MGMQFEPGDSWKTRRDRTAESREYNAENAIVSSRRVTCFQNSQRSFDKQFRVRASQPGEKGRRPFEDFVPGLLGKSRCESLGKKARQAG